MRPILRWVNEQVTESPAPPAKAGIGGITVIANGGLFPARGSCRRQRICAGAHDEYRLSPPIEKSLTGIKRKANDCGRRPAQWRW